MNTSLKINPHPHHEKERGHEGDDSKRGCNAHLFWGSGMDCRML